MDYEFVKGHLKAWLKRNITKKHLRGVIGKAMLDHYNAHIELEDEFFTWTEIMKITRHEWTKNVAKLDNNCHNTGS